MGSVKLQTLIYAWRTLVNNSSRIFGRLSSSGAVFCPKSASSLSTSNVLFLQLLGVKARKAMMQERISAQDAVKSTPLTHEQDIPWFWLVVPQQQRRHSTPRSRQRLRGLSGLWAAVETPELSLQLPSSCPAQWAVESPSLWHSQGLPCAV